MHQEIKDRIIYLLEEIVERAHSINQGSSANAELDIDLVMEDIRSLYRQFGQLRHQGDPKVTGAGVIAQEVGESTFSREAEQKAIDKPRETMGWEPEKEKEMKPDPIQEPRTGKIVLTEQSASELEKTQAEAKKTILETTVKKELDSEPVKKIEHKPTGEFDQDSASKALHEGEGEIHPTKTEATRSVLDLFSSQPASPNVGESLASEDNSLHKRIIGQKEDRSIGARLQMTPIASLKDAIGVNEKFLFINELFGGNIQVYNETIARLNEFKDIQQAFDYLNELNDLLNWNEQRSSQTIEKLANFVQRRFMK